MKIINIKNILFLLLLSFDSKAFDLQSVFQGNFLSTNQNYLKNEKKSNAKVLLLNDLLVELASMEKCKKHSEIKKSNMFAQISFFDYMIKDFNENYKNVSIDVLLKRILACKNFFVDFKPETNDHLFNDCLSYIYHKRSLVQIKLVALEKEIQELIGFISQLYLQLREIDLRGLIFPFGSLDNLCLVGFNLEKSYLPGAHLVEADFSGANLSCTDFQNADMSFAKFDNSILKKAYLVETILHGANFVNSDLSKTCLIQANLINASFNHCNLQYSDLRGASCLFTNFNQSNLSCAKLQDTSFGSGSFVGCCLKGADLSRSRFLRVNFTKADLRETNLSGADLSYANLQGALLDGANIEGAIFKKAIGTNKKADITKLLN